MKKLFTLLFFALLSPLLSAQKAELFVLSVGVEKYRDASLNLNFCADDARDLATALQRQTDLYQLMEVKVLTDAQATRGAIRTELDAFRKKVTSNDLFVFIFSGHGIEDGLVPYDFDVYDPSATKLDKQDLRQKLGALGCNYIVLLDACHSGSFTKQVTGKNVVNSDAFSIAVEQAARQLAEALASTDKNSLVVSSSASDQISFECPDCGHGYFAQAILDCIAGKAVTDPQNKRVIRPMADANGFLSAQAFENYITEAVRVMTLSQANPQKVRVLRSTGGDFPLMRTKVAQQQTTPNAPDTKPGILDTDHDGFDDNKTDECPGEYGTLRGCLDTDGDGIADKRDDCKFEPGLAANRGCPVRDTDGDGVADAVDKCLDIPGKKEWQGCPDSDSDGIPDHLDECPEKKGVAARNGCPKPEETPSLLTDPLAGAFVLVKGGTFTMGCKAGRDSDCSSDETAHQVTLSSSYYMGQTEVTQAQWRAVMGSDPTELYHKGCDQCPVERVSWNDIQDFISKLNSRSGGARYRLPTEAEWEYAARGGSMSRGYQYAGSNNLDEVAWYTSNSGGNTKPVKGKAPNELGLYDMSGNVWEWCSDWYDTYPSGSQTNPGGPTTGSSRVFRGGSWYGDPQDCRVSDRGFSTPVNRRSFVGFRLARTL